MLEGGTEDREMKFAMLNHLKNMLGDPNFSHFG